jgi:hypothetical protein
MKLSDLKSGDLVYWKGQGLWAWLIRKWTRSQFAHVGIVWRNGAGIFYADANYPQGVGLYNFAINTPTHAQHTHSAWAQDTTNFLKSQLGKPYSHWTAVLTVFKIAGKGSRAWMCSEFVVRVLEQMGWDWHGYQPTPEGIRKGVLKSAGYDVEVIE